ncbi:Uma2 family endonuclease [Coleofasciculus sp. H7-2]|uniref:Uma2 family endonuclease n=1 Tax=Coleofasciculus sp. H7-2 TaxID=3351545 RepID=UPI003672089E
MTPTVSDKVRWTTADLELFPNDGKRYEIIDGELFVTRAPHWRHQNVADNVCGELKIWSLETGLGDAATTPGVIFTDADNVIPDVVWASKERLAELLDEAGHLTGAPELVVEVLSPGEDRERRDRQLKLKLYSAQGVRDYWIFAREKQQVEVYRRENGVLKQVATLFKEDNLTSPLLPGFSCSVERLFR